MVNKCVVCTSWAFDVEDEGQDNEDDESKVKPKMLRPGHMAEDATARTGYFAEKM